MNERWIIKGAKLEMTMKLVTHGSDVLIRKENEGVPSSLTKNDVVNSTGLSAGIVHTR